MSRSRPMNFGITPKQVDRTAAMTKLMETVQKAIEEALNLLNMQAEIDPNAKTWEKPIIEVTVPEELTRAEVVAALNEAFAQATTPDGTGIDLVAVPDNKLDDQVDVYRTGHEPIHQ